MRCAIDNLSIGNKNNIKHLLDKYNNLEFIYGDITDLEICRKVMKDIDLICLLYSQNYFF